MYEALLIDFYGTLVEEDTEIISRIVSRVATSSAGAPSESEVAQHWSQRFSELCAAAHGTRFRTQREIELESLRELLTSYDAPLDAEELSGELYSYWVSPEPIPGSAEFLARLTVPVCVVSNIDTADLESAISSLGWRFSAIVTSESCRSYKPRPEPFEAALRTLDCAASCVLHVGDSIGSDLVGAASLGIPSAWVNPRRRSLPREVSSEPVHVVPTVLDLLSQMG